jgi:DNA-binding NarL/FixJ family response regulator
VLESTTSSTPCVGWPVAARHSIQRSLHARSRRTGRYDPLESLMARERDGLALMAQGLSNPRHRSRLWLTERTVGTHVSSLVARLGSASPREPRTTAGSSPYRHIGGQRLARGYSSNVH